MSCFFNNNCCRRPDPCFPRAIVGQVGQMGPQGPAGPPGPAGTIAIASFNNAGTTGLGVGVSLILTDVYNLSSGAITHTTGSSQIVLQNSGYYRVSYNGTVGVTTAGEVSLSAYLNGGLVAEGSTSTVTGDVGDSVVLMADFIIQATSGTELDIRNSGTNTMDIENLNVVVEFISA